ncbi:hypothetical protein BCR32DRAFT_275932 [Anaeromyces robustus]|uniref:Uncharacterized protein n=1 Tax=Anaeromyces robustus TaxID=1754192 RepID=A0A1Y1V1A2_9FUNG|nr:hypothetical protein BCR32DRAFT_288315 [Anaeromyces robustus]ORX44229.1 hypothetical protein BCR32DRAFT_288316 [Anaeromyces robustus]ORX85847.1 hypothetical protein BCR32DRAFT_275932 [Anaeromyces robustus]|eukprot:ORX44228.1 hypothetical protein BCR32DRAFT_288315 [Anaeromyces robustus]
MFKEFLKIPINEHNINNAVVVIVLDLSKKKITKSPRDIAVVNPDFIFQVPFFSFSKCVFYDRNNKPLVNIRDNFEVYSGKDKKIMERKEIIDINIESYFRSAGLFIGKEKKNAPIIYKIIKIKSKTLYFEYILEMVPSVDYIFLMALAIIYMSNDEQIKHRMKVRYH